MPGGNGRPQRGMNNRNHHDSISQSGQQRRTQGGNTGMPKYTYKPAPKQNQSFLDELLFGKKKPGNGKKKR